MPQTQIVLPARLASTRLPEKLLQMVAGKSVLRHTYEAACRAKCASAGVIVAVDDDRIAAEVDSFGGRWIMTPSDCASGTDRIAFVAAEFPQTEVFVNVQSDEPEIDPDAIDAVAETLLADPESEMATAGTPIRTREPLYDPSIVKIVMADFADHGSSGAARAADKDRVGQDRVGQSILEQVRPGQAIAGQAIAGQAIAGQGRAVYFSRACVPHLRDGDPAERLIENPPMYWHHLGLYAYRREFLAWFAQSPPSRLEQIEKLEQLRAIEAGKKIIVAAVGPAKSGIDTPEDLAAFRRRVER